MGDPSLMINVELALSLELFWNIWIFCNCIHIDIDKLQLKVEAWRR